MPFKNYNNYNVNPHTRENAHRYVQKNQLANKNAPFNLEHAFDQ